VAIVAVMLNNYPFSLIGFPFTTISLAIAVIFTILSALEYFRDAAPLLES